MNARKRNHQLAMRLTKDEYATWERKQTASGLNKTDFLMKLADSCVVNIYNYEEAMKPVIAELRKIGNNLNQIARIANSSDSKYLYAITNMQNQYNEVMKMIRLAIKEKQYMVQRVE